VIPLSPANARIEFTGSTALTSHAGHFAAFEGVLEMPTDDPKDVRGRVAVDMDSTTTKIGLLTRHLKAEDFFDVAHYPKAELVLDGVAPAGEPGRFQVAGKLTLHGVQRPVAFPARIAVTADEVSFDGTMTVRQTEFGMTEAAKKTNDEVPVTVSIRARRR
jgi:polyisoprenoid-binding protein YceI